ncbi:MAG TPA: hypothetical protein VF488_06775 [Gemmatimonadaceae bacterium]
MTTSVANEPGGVAERVQIRLAQVVLDLVVEPDEEHGHHARQLEVARRLDLMEPVAVLIVDDRQADAPARLRQHRDRGQVVGTGVREDASASCSARRRHGGRRASRSSSLQTITADSYELPSMLRIEVGAIDARVKRGALVVHYETKRGDEATQHEVVCQAKPKLACTVKK